MKTEDINFAARLASIKNWQPQYLILDAALCPEPLWFAKGAGLNCHTLFNYGDVDLVDSGPWLFERPDQLDFIKLVLEKDKLGHSSLWFCSDLSFSDLLQALTARLYALKPDETTTRFRFYDTRILHYYLLDEDKAKQAGFLAPFKAVMYAELNPFHFETHWHSWQIRAQQVDYVAVPINVAAPIDKTEPTHKSTS